METHREEEVTHRKIVQPQSGIMDFHPREVSGCCAARVMPHAGSSMVVVGVTIVSSHTRRSLKAI